jgi:dihydrolipoamide dehydrogenase
LSADTYDVTVIGTGPGGYVAAIRAAQMGLKTAIVERDPAGTGGTCLQRGCIPTKALLHTADLYEEMKHAKDYGIVVQGMSIDFPALMSRKSRIVTRLSKGIEGYLFKKNGITLFKGTGRLEGKNTVVVTGDKGETKVSSKNIVLATGSRPRSLPNLPIDGKRIITSDHLLEIKEMPKSMVVIGAGAVGIEFASVFARLGSTVTVIEMLPRVLPLEDEEISNEAGKMLGKFFTIHVGAKTESATVKGDGVDVAVRMASGELKTITAEVVLVAVGRGPVTDGLNIEGSGATLERGYIRVNNKMETGVAGLYAIGDVVTVDGKPHAQLAHVASHEGMGVMERLAGKHVEPLNYDHVPSATYSLPEVAGIGLTEAEAKKRGFDVKIGRFPFPNLAKPRIIGQDFGFIKVVADSKYDEVLGVHMIGPHVTDLISEAALALRLESTVEEISRTIHPHPTLGEAMGQAAEAVYGHAIDA